MPRRIQDPVRQVRRIGGVDTRGPAGEDHSLRVQWLDVRPRGVVRHEFAVDAALADAAGDELAVLGTEVEHHDRINGSLILGILTQQVGRLGDGRFNGLDVTLGRIDGDQAVRGGSRRGIRVSVGNGTHLGGLLSTSATRRGAQG